MESVTMTREQFEQEYAERSGVTVEWLHKHGQAAQSCDCGEEDCVGWAMVSGRADSNDPAQESTKAGS